MVEHLATVVADPDRLWEAIDRTALRGPDGEPFWSDILFRIGERRVDTPIGSIARAPAGYTSVAADYFERLALHADRPVRVLFALADVERLAVCMPPADRIELSFHGDPEVCFATELRASAGGGTVSFDRLSGPDAVAGAPERMPSRFEGGQFRLEDGLPAPVRVDTTATALRRVARAVESFDGDDYPLVVDESGPMLDIHRSGVAVEAPLPGELVDGEPVHNVYGEGFARAARAFEGDLRLETAPNGPLAIVDEHEDLVARVVLAPK